MAYQVKVKNAAEREARIKMVAVKMIPMGAENAP